MKAAKAFGRKAHFVPGRGKQKFTDGEVLSFEDLLRKATAKTLLRPDTETNQQVADAVKDGVANSTLSMQHLDHLLYERLTLNNPHKVFLAINLIRVIVDQALQERVQALQQVMGELNSIASRPMNRYASDLPAQQQVKSGAYSLLRHLAGGDNEKEPTSPRSSFGVQSTPSPRARGAGADMSNAEIREANWPKLRNMLESQMMLVTSKLEQVQDMVVQISAGGDVKFQRSHLEDLARELQGFRAKFEPLLARLSSYSTDEATALMSRALEMMDTITNSIKLKDEVLSAGSSSAAATAPTLQYAPRAAPSGPLNTSPAKPNNISSALDGIAELQQAFNTPAAPSQTTTAPRDPFALPGDGPSIGTPHAGGQAASNPFKPAPYNPMQGGSYPPQASSSGYQDPFSGSSSFGPASGPPSFQQGSQQQPSYGFPGQASFQQQAAPSSGGYNPFSDDAPAPAQQAPQASQPPADPFGQLFGSGGVGQGQGRPTPSQQQYSSQQQPQQQYSAQQPQQPPGSQAQQYGNQQFGAPQAPQTPFGSDAFAGQPQQQHQQAGPSQQQPFQGGASSQQPSQPSSSAQGPYAHPQYAGTQGQQQQYQQPGQAGAYQGAQSGHSSFQQPQQAAPQSHQSNPFANPDDALVNSYLGAPQAQGHQSQPFGGNTFGGAPSHAGSNMPGSNMPGSSHQQQPAKPAEADPFDALFSMR